MERIVGVLQAGQGILFLVFGGDRQKHADLLQALKIGLKHGKILSGRHFRTYDQIFGAVIADHTAPKRIVQIHRNDLFVFSIDGLDNRG